MEEFALEPWELPDTSSIVTEDGKPVDSFLAEKAQRLLTESLYASWQGPPSDEDSTDGASTRPFLAAANVGLFSTPKSPPLVPDVMVSTDARLEELSGEDERRSYFLWEIGKPPEVVIEIVSDRAGEELATKRRKYARMHVLHYVVWDPRRVWGPRPLRVFSLAGDVLREVNVTGDAATFAELNLGVRLWTGRFEGTHATWLRFTDAEGNLLLTGIERAEAEKQRAEAEKQRAEAEKQRADRLAARLRALGIDPDAD